MGYPSPAVRVTITAVNCQPLYSRQIVCQDICVTDSRAYNSPLREEQTRLTRELILGNLVELVSEQGAADLSIRDLAKRAAVSERTVYRHFPDRAALLEGLTAYVEARSSWPSSQGMPGTLDGLVEMIPPSFASYDEREAEMRAMVLLNLDPARVASLTRRHQEVLRETVAREFPNLDESRQREAVSVIHLLASSRTWLRFRDQDGLEPGQAGRAAADATAAYIAWLRRENSQQTGK